MEKVAESFHELVVKGVDTAISVKFFVICISTWLFYIDKLNQDGWITMVLSVTGMRVLNEVSSMYKDIRTSQISNKKK